MKDFIINNWDHIMDLLVKEHDVSEIAVKTWIRPLTIHEVTDDTITFVLDSNFDQRGIDFIKTKYYDLYLQLVISGLTNKSFNINFILSSRLDEEKEKKKAPVSEIPEDSPFKQLNPKYTFSTFVVGNNNKLAHAAAVAVAESPAEAYNPLFLYGGVGLGKTHLMHSIAHHILENDSTKKVLYVTSEKFTNELIDSIKHDKNQEFRSKYRDIDVLLIDDIQFIVGKESTQEEFFHTFNTLHEAKKQIIISSDRPPKDMSTLEDRLRSRFEWGLTADIQAPDYETRMAILRNRSELDHLDIDDEIMIYVATNIKSNIRELEGALNKICAFANLEKREIDLNLAEEALKDLITPEGEGIITPELILRVVAEHYEISVQDLVSKKKSQKISYPRQVAMYLCRQLTDESLQYVGKMLGGRDHSTILHGCERIENDLVNNEPLQTTINVIIKKIDPTS